MTISRRDVQIKDKEINKIKITCVKILKQLFASGLAILRETIRNRYMYSLMLVSGILVIDKFTNSKYNYTKLKFAHQRKSPLFKLISSTAPLLFMPTNFYCARAMS